MLPSQNEPLRLNDLLQLHQQEILARWEQLVREFPDAPPLSSSSLRDHVPELLQRISGIVSPVHEPQPGGLEDLPDLHALHRLETGFDLAATVRELSALRAVVLELWEPHVAQHDPVMVAKEVRRFDEAMDEVVGRSISRYSKARERTLTALGEVSAAAMSPGELDTFLARLLDILLRTTGAADLALVELVDGEMVRVAAAVGLGADVASGSSTSAGEGVAGRVASTREPLLVRDAGRDPLVATRGVKGSRIRALYAVPLWNDATFIGVVYMASATAYDFSAHDKQLVGAVAQRAASTIAQAELAGRERSALQALQRSETELRRVMEVSPDMLAVVGLDGFMKRVNPAFRAALGYSDEELLAKPYQEFIHPDDRERVRAELDTVLRGKPAHRVTFRMVRNDGTLRWMSFNASAEPQTHLLVAVGRDITEERERSEFEKQLIGIVSHDLRNPLSAILMSSTTLMRRLGDLDERTAKGVARIHAAAERAAALIRDLLDFTKARTAGGIAITPQPLDLHQQARRVAQEVHAIYPDRALEIEQQGEGEGFWDPARIAQVVENLVSNAFKYGALDVPVLVRTLGGERWVRLEVHNGGEAIDPALLPHIFEPLRQGAAAGAVGGVTGVGLGLYIVDHIVRAHGGTIDVHSTAAEGTTFIVRLPREPPAQT